MRFVLMAIGLSSMSSAFSSRPRTPNRRYLTVRGGASTSPPDIKVYYGDFPFWRAECVRVALHVGGVPFEDIRDWAEGKKYATFGSLPVMMVDGKVLSQTQAMATYVGKLTGLYPEDSWLAAKHDEIINGCTDVTNTVAATMRIKDEAEKIRARASLILPDGRLTLQLSGLEKLIVENGRNGVAIGDSLTVADLAIWRLAGWLSDGILDGLPRGYVTNPENAYRFPAIAKVFATVDNHESVVQWKTKHSKFFSREEQP